MQTEQLTHLTLITVGGDDADSFLQGQLTQDIINLPEHEWRYAAFCNPKGRVVALFMVWRKDNQLQLLTEKNVAEKALTLLKRYVLRSKVTFNQPDSIAFYGASDFQTLLEDLKCQPTNAKQSLLFNGNKILLNIRGRGLLITDEVYSAATLEQTPFWLSADIRDGLPRVTEKNSEAFVPQMLNLDLLDGINFKKGCYTGQEIVARMHYLGKLKQRMYLCQLDHFNSPPEIGETVQNLENKTLGNIVSSAGKGGFVLAVLRSQDSEGELRCAGGTTIQLAVEQPYDGIA